MTPAPEIALWEKKLRSPEYGQGHLFDDARCTDKEALIRQLMDLETKIPGGLLGYIERSKKLMVEAKEAKNPLDEYVIGTNVSLRFSHISASRLSLYYS